MYLKTFSEINEIIAEHLMLYKRLNQLDVLKACGIRPTSEQLSSPEKTILVPFKDTEELLFLKENGLFSESMLTVPNYSTDFNLAWRVVEVIHMNNKHSFNLNYDYSTDVIEAQFIAKDGTIYSSWGGSDPMESHDPPLAICLAALKASGIKI